MNEQPIVFSCSSTDLVGILHVPNEITCRVGLLIVVGGPQYRVGSHRQFVLLARHLASKGIPVFRFDYRGMGDSDGEHRSFEDINDDIAAAIERFLCECPGLNGIALWGLCDAATANAFYVHNTKHAVVVGQIALNPWVFTAEGNAEAYLKHYYGQRLLSWAFWRKVLTLKFDLMGSVKSFLEKIRSVMGKKTPSSTADLPLPQKLCDAQLSFLGPTLIILSGQDLTAKEYVGRVGESSVWREWQQSDAVELRTLEDADHTFSRAVWRDQVAVWTCDWLLGLANSQAKRS